MRAIFAVTTNNVGRSSIAYNAIDKIKKTQTPDGWIASPVKRYCAKQEKQYRGVKLKLRIELPI